MECHHQLAMDLGLAFLLCLPSLMAGQGMPLPAQCNVEPQVGVCEGVRDRAAYFFNHTSGHCDYLWSAGCDDNTGLFQTFSDCQQTCGCNLPPERGHCQEHIQMYHFNAESGTCETFDYSGCGGNQNRHATETECLQTCVCSRPPETGHCRASMPSFYFDAGENSCKPFIYGGCGGNANRFPDLASCRSRCVCNLQPQPGMCMAYFPKYFYNAAEGQCQQFIYGGCQGNGNRFGDVETCQSTCGASVAVK